MGVNGSEVHPVAVGNARGRRGRLMVYLGAAPGVGKTYAMLDEAARRMMRGTDVVVGLVETHGRAGTAAKLEGLETIARRELAYRGTTLTEMDTAAIIDRRPDVALVDELAHTNAPGSKHAKRWQDIEEILDAGIDVVTTVNVQHLASLTDDVEAVTGVRQRETVPDQVVRDAHQIQLVDISPQQLRRRLAHGNIYRPEQIDASLGSYFREGNLTALRELALLWLADRVDDALTRYRADHAIRGIWPARERIVVAVTGGPESQTLIRRGARIAQRAAGSELLVVHVLPTDGLPPVSPATVAALREVVESLDGTFHTVIGEEVAAAVIDFAHGVNATMVVVGVSQGSRLKHLFVASTADEIATLSGAIDVHLVTHEFAGRRSARRPAATISLRRRVWGYVTAVLAPGALTAVLVALGFQAPELAVPLLLLLVVVLGVALLGGLGAALVASVVSFGLSNWFFTQPTGQFFIAAVTDVVALAVFVLVAVSVATLLNLARRRTVEAYRARAEAATLAALSRQVLAGDDSAQAIVERLAEMFGQDEVRIEERPGEAMRERGAWTVLARAGQGEQAGNEQSGTSVVRIDDDHRLVLRGRDLPASDRQAVEAFGSQAAVVLEHRRLRAAAAQARALEDTEATRTALLAAVSHDLRTPLAAIRAAVDGLTLVDVELGADDTAALEVTLAESTTRLERLIDNLLDLSRLQTGAVRPVLRDTSLEEVVLVAVEPWLAFVDLEVPEDLPLVRADAGLLERVVANLVSNAVRHAGSRVRVTVWAENDDAVIRVVDRGPGVPDARKATMFQPFQRLGDVSDTGLGLGLAVARGLADATGANVVAEDTPGGGLTMVVTLPLRVPAEVPAPAGTATTDAEEDAR